MSIGQIIILSIIGLAGGGIIAAGVFALITTTGVMTRFASNELKEITLKYQAITGRTDTWAPIVTARLSAANTGSFFLKTPLKIGAIYKRPAVAPKDS